MMVTNAAEALEFSRTLTLENDGLPSVTEDIDNVSQLYAHGIQVGKDVFTLDRFIKWTEKKTQAQVQAASSGGGGFGKAQPCPITEAEFGKYAPDQLHCLFFTPAQFKQLQTAFPAGLGQPLRSMKKWGEPKLNPKTGKKSGGRYKSGSYGYFLSGVVAIPVEVPDKGIMTVRGRPTINMALEGTKVHDDDAQMGDGEDEE